MQYLCHVSNRPTEPVYAFNEAVEVTQKPFERKYLLEYLARFRDKQSFQVARDCQTTDGFTVRSSNWQGSVFLAIGRKMTSYFFLVFKFPVSSSMSCFVSKIRHFHFFNCYLHVKP